MATKLAGIAYARVQCCTRPGRVGRPHALAGGRALCGCEPTSRQRWLPCEDEPDQEELCHACWLRLEGKCASRSAA